MKFKVVLAVCLLAAALPALSQTAPSAIEGPVKLQVGAGFTDFNGDFANGRLHGGTLWVDCMACGLPKMPKDLGLELEARGIRKPEPNPPTWGSFQQAGFAGGITYTYTKYPRFRPYGKLLVGYSGIDFYIGQPHFHHVSMVMYQPGAGFEYRLVKELWLRGDYEYQIWPQIFRGSKFTLDPQGITVGAVWTFRARR